MMSPKTEQKLGGGDLSHIMDYTESPPKTASAVIKKTRRDIKKVFTNINPEGLMPDDESQ